MIVLGLDLSYTRAGIVGLHWDEESNTIVTVVFQDVVLLGGRHAPYALGNALDTFWACTEPSPGLSAVIEEVPGKYLQRLMGCCLGVLQKRRIPYITIVNSITKKLIGGSAKGTARETKALVAAGVRKRVHNAAECFNGDEKLGSDLYDAAGHALVGLSKRGFRL